MATATATPPALRVLCDVNLLYPMARVPGATKVALYTQLSKENWRELVKGVLPPSVPTYELACAAFCCDTCQYGASAANPVYMSAENAGTDVCTACIRRGFAAKIEPTPGSPADAPVYSLADIVFARTVAIAAAGGEPLPADDCCHRCALEPSVPGLVWACSVCKTPQGVCGRCAFRTALGDAPLLVGQPRCVTAPVAGLAADGAACP